MAGQLTSVPVRTSLLSKLDEHIALSGHGAELLGLILLKLGGLDTVNGELGNEVGDIVLSEFYDRLRDSLRPSDLAFRTGGARFAVVMPTLIGTGQAELAITKITKVARQPIEVSGHSLRLSVNAGLAIYPQHAQHPQRLIYCAETALNSAKSLSKAFTIYSKKQITRTLSVLSLETELEKAIENGEIDLHHQPKIDLGTREVVGVESLARWTSEVHGPVRPDVFIEIAERSGLILPLTLLTVNLALRQCQELQVSDQKLSVAINLSPAVLNDSELRQLIKRALSIWGTEADRLTLEITENAMMEDPKKSLNILKSLRSEDVSISIDDFGTGYSSLSYLKNLPVNELKIDKSFVLNMMDDEGDAKIVKSIIDLAHNFDLAVVAEGIENQQSLDRLAEMGCDSAQGFYIARPMPLEELKKWLSSSSRRKQRTA